MMQWTGLVAGSESFGFSAALNNTYDDSPTKKMFFVALLSALVISKPLSPSNNTTQ
jgi:hypothetical protein